MRLRQEQAAQLMGDILTDQPQLPLPTTPRTDTHRPRDDAHRPRDVTRTRGARQSPDSLRTPKKTGRKPGTGIAGKTVVRSIAGTSPSPSRSTLRDKTWTLDKDQGHLTLADYPYDAAPDGQAPRASQIPRPRQFAERVEPDAIQQNVGGPDDAATTSARRRPVKKLEDMVRLQRPHVTRRVRRDPPKTHKVPQTREEASTARSTGTVREQQRLYGKN